MSIRPFTISVPGEVLADLRERLARTRWPEQLPDAGWDYGANLAYIRELCDYWANGYDWRLHESHLNRYPGFLAEVDGVDLHFWHITSGNPSAIPLLLVHGWPGSIFEFNFIIDRLVHPEAHGNSAADAFDLVIPALPGFGFGGKPRERGWGISRIAAAFHTLMTRELGYRRYGVQGGDWGGIISAKMASAYPESVIGAHLNFLFVQPPPNPTEEDRKYIAARDAFQANETGYSLTQGTKPDSLTLAQSDSPAGLAAWVVEKFHTWGDVGSNIEETFSKDVLLTNLMFYWAPNSVASSARIYYEARRDPAGFVYPRVEVPTGVAVFPREPWRVPRHWAEQRFNIVHWTEMPRGGHFAALEQPALLASDIIAFFRPLRAR
ncbi:epoxide hydrolase family protein [Tepidiforma bonchosmolovskayae]|uniref:Epoxide hydrolase n=1 Tax=Tepidiforma bonchosmolovskayae TaxID=2601677 RepID=A0ABX6C3U3_9CHLR|nr:epoxide hydrolase family protein [Tepidiforma bonchosmolovskayae]QFG03907.1 epoxide hydrolase [Tepidiforma bonchosmolovskayae]